LIRNDLTCSINPFFIQLIDLSIILMNPNTLYKFYIPNTFHKSPKIRAIRVSPHHFTKKKAATKAATL